jgi:hypothetical protein
MKLPITSANSDFRFDVSLQMTVMKRKSEWVVALSVHSVKAMPYLVYCSLARDVCITVRSDQY